MKKAVLSISLFFSFIAYAATQRVGIFGNQTPYANPVARNDQPNQQITNIPQRSRSMFDDDDEYEDDDDDFIPRANTTIKPSTSNTNTTISSNKQTPPPVSNTMMSQMMGNSGMYRNGMFTGPVVDAYYGNVQIKTIISGGKIADVQFLDYPQDRNNSIRINTYAMPILKQEAISAQNANVDVVSGATATSDAFIQSLSSALAQAKN